MKGKKIVRSKLASAASCILFIWGTGSVNAVWAETGGSTPVLEEVVVTAQKRTENLQDVPIAIQSFSDVKLEKAGIEVVQDLSMVAPSIIFAEQSGALYTSIRGLGARTNANGVYNNVALYIDGQYMPRPAAGLTDVGTMENIQILKGPQGTLYGRNATAGAIIITTPTAHPGDPLSGNISATFGSDHMEKYKGHIKGGITDTLAGMFAFSHSEQDGYVKNISPWNDPDLGEEKYENYQIKLTWEPTDRVSMWLSSGYLFNDSDTGVAWQCVTPDLCQQFFGGTIGSILQAFGTPAAQAAALGGALAPLANFDFPYGTTADQYINPYSSRGLNPPVNKLTRHTEEGSFFSSEQQRLAYELTIEFDKFDLISHTAYNDNYSDRVAGVVNYTWADGGALFDTFFAGSGLNANGGIGFAGQFDAIGKQQEIRLVSKDSNVEWMLGLNYFNESGRTIMQQGFFGFNFEFIDNMFENEAKAVYGQATYPLTDTVDLTGGIRYTIEKHEIEDHFANLGKKDKDFDSVTWNITAEWTRDEGMYYASLRTGFKSGAYNTVNFYDDGVDPEELIAYEVGFKSDFPSQRLRLNLAAFYYDFSNQHIATFDPTGQGTTIFVDDTKSEYYGLEGEVDYLVTDNFTVTTAFLMEDGEYKNDATDSVGNIIPLVDIDPAQMANISASIGLEYRLYTSIGELTFTSTTRYSSGYWHSRENTVGTGGANDDAFVVSNMNIRLDMDNIYAQVFANNVFDEEYWTSAVVQPGGANFGIPARGTEFGVIVGYNF